MNKEEPATFNINLLTGDITTVPLLLPVQSTSGGSSQVGQMLPPADPDVPSSSGTFQGKIKPPRKSKEPEKDSVEYVNRRQRNNVAVRKSREKTRERSKYTLEKIEQLKGENDQLESKISILTKELSVLKDLFMDHARGFCTNGSASLLNAEQLEKLLGCKVIKSEIRDGASSESQADRPGTSAGPPGAAEPPFNVDQPEFKPGQPEKTEEVLEGSSDHLSGASGSLLTKVEP